MKVLGEGLATLRAALAAEDQSQQEVTDADREVLESVSRLRTFVEEHQLDSALCWLFREVRHYPTWSKRDDAARWIKLPLRSIEGDKSPTLGEIIRFEMFDLQLELRFKQWGSYGPDTDSRDYADLGLFGPDGTALLAVTAVRTDVDGGWSPSKVEAFRTGEWALRLTDLYVREQNRAARELRRSLSELDKIDELRRSFDIEGVRGIENS